MIQQAMANQPHAKFPEKDTRSSDDNEIQNQI